MKIKLLKKIRKRFSIVHYPSGYIVYILGTKHLFHGEKGCVRLQDKENKLSCNYSLNTNNSTVEGCLQAAKDKILEWCRNNYTSKANHIHMNRYKGIKLWHNG